MSQVSTPIMESAYDGGISGKELEDIYRKAEFTPKMILEDLNQMEIFRQGLEDAGFDSIIHDRSFQYAKCGRPETSDIF